MTTHIFTYGTLMFLEVWRSVVGRPFDSVGGWAPGFAIYRVRGAEFPGIVATTTNDSVRGVVYLDVDRAALDRLDRFEDDFYQRQRLTVVCDDGTPREAEAYVVPEALRDVLSDEPWSAEELVARGGLERFRRQFLGFRRLAEED